jgi:uncharacterized protein (TIGR00369 family)
MAFQPTDPDFEARVSAYFHKARFIAHLGIELADLGPGWCETRLTVQPEHHQQDEFIHAGVVATLADHTAGAAAGTLVAANQIILTAEYKINLLRPAVGETLHARADVLRPGRSLIVAESSVYSLKENNEKLVSKALVTLSVV